MVIWGKTMSILLFLTLFFCILSLGLLLLVPTIFGLSPVYIFYKYFRYPKTGLKKVPKAFYYFLTIWIYVLLTMLFFMGLVFLYQYTYLINGMVYLFQNLQRLDQVYTEFSNVHSFSLLTVGMIYTLFGVAMITDHYYPDFEHKASGRLEMRKNLHYVNLVIAFTFSIFLTTGLLFLSQLESEANRRLLAIIFILVSLFFILLTIPIIGREEKLIISDNELTAVKTYFHIIISEKTFEKNDFTLKLESKDLQFKKDIIHRLDTPVIKNYEIIRFKIKGNFAVGRDIVNLRKYIQLCKEHHIKVQDWLEKAVMERPISDPVSSN